MSQKKAKKVRKEVRLIYGETAQKQVSEDVKTLLEDSKKGD